MAGLQSVSPAVVDAHIAKQWQRDNAVPINTDSKLVIRDVDGKLKVLDHGKAQPITVADTASFTAADHSLIVAPRTYEDYATEQAVLKINTEARAESLAQHPSWPEAFEHVGIGFAIAFGIIGAIWALGKAFR